MFRGSNLCTGIRAAAPRFTALNANCNEWITLSKRQPCVAGISAIEALSRSRAHLCARFKNTVVSRTHSHSTHDLKQPRDTRRLEEGGTDGNFQYVLCVSVSKLCSLGGRYLPVDPGCMRVTVGNYAKDTLMTALQAQTESKQTGKVCACLCMLKHSGKWSRENLNGNAKDEAS